MYNSRKKIACFFVLFSFCIITGFTDPEIKTIQFQRDENGYIQFFTNDVSLYNYGFTGYSEEIISSGVFELEIVLNSGSEYVGRGMIFGAENEHKWYAILIETRGSYTIIKNINGQLTELAKGSTNQITRGLGNSNIVKAVRRGRNIEIFINNNRRPIYTIRNIEFEGDKMGYFVMVGDSEFESFPQIPLDIRFRKIY